MAEAQRLAITISREVGAGGAVLGERIASKLGFTYLDREILRVIADHAGVTEHSLAKWDERLSGFWDRLIESFAVGTPEAIYTPAPEHTVLRDAELFELEVRAIREFAQRRNVVVIGRAGFWVLRDHPGLIKIFLHAPVVARVPMVMRAYNLHSETEAREMIGRVDVERQRFVQKMCGCGLFDSRNYDLAIDTKKISFDLAEEMILKLVDRVRSRSAGT